MRALVVAGPGRSAVTDVPEPVPGPGEVLVSVEAAGICGSDLELLDGRRPAAYVSYPVVPGHEWAGRVEALGPGVRELARATRWWPRGCAPAASATAAPRDGQTCARPGTPRPASPTRRPGRAPGRPARLVHRLPADRPLAPAALLEAAACVASGLLEAGMPLPGTRVAVVGDGPLGLLALLLLATASPAELVLVGGRPARSALGPGCGATRVVAAGDPDALAGLAGHFDTVVEATNVPAGAATALTLLRRRARRPARDSPAPGAPSTPGCDAHKIRVKGAVDASPPHWRWVTGLDATGALEPTPSGNPPVPPRPGRRGVRSPDAPGRQRRSDPDPHVGGRGTQTMGGTGFGGAGPRGAVLGGGSLSSSTQTFRYGGRGPSRIAEDAVMASRFRRCGEGATDGLQALQFGMTWLLTGIRPAPAGGSRRRG